MMRRVLGLWLLVGCGAGRAPAQGPEVTTGQEHTAARREPDCEWRPIVTVYVDNRSSMDIQVSFGSYAPARLASAFSSTTYRIARTYLQSYIRLRIARGGLQEETPPPIQTEYIPCNEATLIIGPRPRYSFFFGGPPLGEARPGQRQPAESATRVAVDSLGVLRWTATGEEVALFGVNYSSPFAYAFRAHGYLGIDRRQAIDRDVLHLDRMGLDAYRIHVWDREVSDRDGNLVPNEHLDLLDYLLSRLAEHGIRVILTPIAWWPTGYPEPDPVTNGLSDGYSKGEMTTSPIARQAQENYLRQFITHMNTYTGFSYAEDPNLLAVEIFNEPSHPGGAGATTQYIDAMANALRDAGFDKPIFYNISQEYSDAHGRAVCAAEIDGVSHQWYPTGLVRNSAVGGNMLPNVERYTIPYADFAECRNKARMVYEFDAADVAGSYLYPAMARSFRSAGFQWATQFAYDPVALAYANTEYQTHFLNLVYTPGKAISFMIAGEVFRRTPRGATYGRHPDSDRFGPFRVSYAEDLSELVEDTVFLYSNDTGTAPPSPARLGRVAGVGTSPVVSYAGSGAYFLDRLDEGIWRLEVYPDAAWVVDPFTRGSLDREAARVIWRTRSMHIALPDLGAGYVAEPVDSGNDHRPVVRGGTLDVRPGVYLLRRSGTTRPAWTAATVVGGRALGAFFAPPTSSAPTAVVHAPPVELTSGRSFDVRADVVARAAPDSVVLSLRRDGAADRPLRLPMAPAGAFGYRVEVPAERVQEGLLEYAISVYEGGRVRTFPGGETGDPMSRDHTGRAFWQVAVVTVGTPLVLFDGRLDQAHVLYPHQWEYVRFRTEITAASEPDRRALSAVVEDFTPSPHHFALRTFLPDAQRTRLAEAGDGGVLRIRARAAGRASDRMEVALIERDGTAWGAVIELTDAWRDIAIPLADLRPAPLALLPRPYPQFLPYLRETITGRARVRLAELDGLQFAVGANLFQDDDREGAHGFEIERVVVDIER